MKTRDRILLCTLALFNEHGEPNVTTLDIANELDISPGNLYYHFRGKEALLEALLDAFIDNTQGLLQLDIDPDELSPEDYWLFLHLLFESIISYRFLFQDLSNLTGRYGFINRAMQQWIAALRKTLLRVLLALREQGHMDCDDESLERLLDTLCQTFLFWLDYQRITRGDQQDASLGVRQVLGLLLPYLDADTREWMLMLINRYA
ncbi:TetR/AcrR family transcriptional regulator [Halopseudomonas pelagia]|uniref:TetR family transcriptional regulator n=1 Tax=Halopseudomonas pelagia TaxID=553151 RepID=A0AA91U289_9GAMM|nr:TetR/AcrR family transcriptional regulator [Halopseudomonas pelagia]PCC99380.1 TetR family transcriptional regulator [Halopseudomonas pelagia]QFY55479.1 TetR/AcrR family transcriptional regulator [Halopseudomonas pelagia]